MNLDEIIENLKVINFTKFYSKKEVKILFFKK